MAAPRLRECAASLPQPLHDQVSTLFSLVKSDALGHDPAGPKLPPALAAALRPYRDRSDYIGIANRLGECLGMGRAYIFSLLPEDLQPS